MNQNGKQAGLESKPSISCSQRYLENTPALKYAVLENKPLTFLVGTLKIG